LQGVEAQSGRVDTGARRREVRKAEVSEVGPAALGLASHVMPVISDLVTLEPGKASSLNKGKKASASCYVLWLSSRFLDSPRQLWYSGYCYFFQKK
jgi:hypothetical protein